MFSIIRTDCDNLRRANRRQKCDAFCRNRYFRFSPPAKNIAFNQAKPILFYHGILNLIFVFYSGDLH